MKVIIPLAGEGTRMRPHTHTKPKPLFEFAGKSCLSHILDELKLFNDKQKKNPKVNKKEAVISEIIFITGKMKEKIEEFVTKNYDFKARFIEQKVRDGTAGAIRLAQPYVKEPVIIVYVDTIFEADLGLINKLKADEGGIIWAKEVEDYQRFGVCVLDNSGYIKKIVEKPKPEEAPSSRLAAFGRFVLVPEICQILKELPPGKEGELWLTDAIEEYIRQGNLVVAQPVQNGRWYTTGDPLRFLEAVIQYTLARDDYGPTFREYLKRECNSNGIK